MKSKQANKKTTKAKKNEKAELKMIEEYFIKYDENTKIYGENVIVLWQSGKFYEVYGIKNNDTGLLYGNRFLEYVDILCCQYSEKKCKVNLHGVFPNHTDNHTVLMGGMPIETELDKYVPKLNENGFVVVVYNQEDSKLTNKKTRKLAHVFSIGTNFECCKKKLSNWTTCLWFESFPINLIRNQPKIYISGCSIDINTGKVELIQYQYQNNKIIIPDAFFEIEQYISKYNPSEIIFVHNFEDEKILSKVIDFCSIKNIKLNKTNINSNYIKKIKNTDEYKYNNTDKVNIKYRIADNCEKEIYRNEIIERYYNPNSFENFIETTNLNDNTYAYKSLCYLIGYLDFNKTGLTRKLKNPTFSIHSKNVYLCNNSLNQLNIINKDDTNLSLTNMLIKESATKMGNRLFYNRLVNPIFDVKQLESEYSLIQYIIDNYQDFIEIRKKLKQLSDLDRMERKIVFNRFNHFDILVLHNNLSIVKEIIKLVKNKNKVKIKNKNLFSILTNQNYKTINSSNNDILEFIDKHINLDVISNKYAYVIKNIFKKNIFSKLDEYNEEINITIEKINIIHEYLTYLFSEKELKRNKDLIRKVTKDDNYYLELTSRRSATLKEALKKTKDVVPLSFMSKTSNKKEKVIIKKESIRFSKGKGGNVKIHLDVLDELVSNYSEKYLLIDDLVNEYFNDFKRELFNDYRNNIELINSFISNIDFAITRAYIANSSKFKYCKPTIDKEKNNGKSFFDAKQMRHPILEKIITDVIYVPNDVQLGLDINGMLIYGTNSVGKSSLIKAVGMVTIMAQAGMFVPCEKFSFFPYKTICTRILNNDNIYKGLSTFGVECSELSIIDNMKSDSCLVLGDEVCSGTEVKSALIILITMLKRLDKSNSNYMFATHFHQLYEEYNCLEEIKGMRMKHLSVKHVKNCDGDYLVYDRVLKDGPGENFYGIEVMKSYNFTSDFITDIMYNMTELFPENSSIMESKENKYNKKLINYCEECKIRPAVDTHHMIPQHLADEKGLIGGFHKNHLANTMSLCKMCHDIKTKNNIVEIKKQTTKGIKTIVVEPS